MLGLVRSKDWSGTPLGPMERWPQSLRSAVDICLGGRFPMHVWWGPELINIYNDAHCPILGGRHPDALGRSAPDVWADVWPVLAPQVEAVMCRGESTWNEQTQFLLERNGVSEEAWFTWSYSPIRDEAGRIAGLMCVSTEDTARVLAERERKRLDEQRQRQQAEERARNLLESVTDAFFSLDEDWRFTYMNPQGGRILGRPPSDLIGKVIWNEYPGLYNSVFEPVYRRAMTERVGGAVTAFYPDHNCWYEVHSYPSPNGISIYFRDVSDREDAEREQKRLRREVETERERLADVFQRAPSFMCVLRGADHVFERVNDRYYELVGHRDIIGKPAREALPEVEGPGFFEHLDAVYRTGEPFTGADTPFIVQRGRDIAPEERTVDFVYQALRSADGAITGILVQGIDITERKRAEEALRGSEQMRRLALDSAELGAFHIDPTTFSLTSDVRFRDIFGITGDRIDYEGAVAVIHPDDRAMVRNAVAAATRPDDPAPYAAEYRVVHPDGSIHWVFARGRANFAPEGKGRKLVSFDGTVADITDRKRAEEALRDARDVSESANRAKDRFLAVLSHELRTPLSPVVMTIPAIELDPDLPAKFRDDLAMVRRNIDLEVKLIDDLLDLSRVTSGKLRLQMQPVATHDVLRHAIHSSLSDTSGKHVRVCQRFEASNDRLIADPARLQQVFWNLLRNAVKFAPEGSEITVRTWNAEDNGQLGVGVQDNGIGIDPALLPRIFDAFEQGDAGMTRQFGGLGLGLAIAKAVVEMHGGAISAASPGRDRGASFTVMLNTAPASAWESARAEPPRVTPRSPARSRILLVEDHPDTARMLAKLLNLTGYEVKTAGTARLALQLAAAERFDVVVSDIGLPDATGYDLMQQIRERHGIKGIALTGYGMEDDLRKSREAGFVDHVVKPVNVAQLEAVIQRVTGGE